MNAVRVVWSVHLRDISLSDIWRTDRIFSFSTGFRQHIQIKKFICQYTEKLLFFSQANNPDMNLALKTFSSKYDAQIYSVTCPTSFTKLSKNAAISFLMLLYGAVMVWLGCSLMFTVYLAASSTSVCNVDLLCTSMRQCTQWLMLFWPSSYKGARKLGLPTEHNINSANLQKFCETELTLIYCFQEVSSLYQSIFWHVLVFCTRACSSNPFRKGNTKA